MLGNLYQGLVNVPIKHHPTIQIIEGDVKPIPKKGHLPTPVHIEDLMEI